MVRRGLLDPLEPDLQTVVSCKVGVGNGTRVFLKSIKCS